MKTSTLYLRRRIVNAFNLGISVLATVFGLFWLAWLMWTLISRGVKWVDLALFTQITPQPAASGGGIYNGDFFGSPGTLTLASVVDIESVPDNCAGCDAATAVRAVPRRHPSGAPGPGFAALGVAQAMLQAASQAGRGRP